MPLVRVNAVGDRPVLHGGGDLAAALSRGLSGLPRGAPVVVLIHGYKFAPGHRSACPHGHILSLRPRPGCRKAISWPRHLGFGRGQADEGLCVALGWQARGSIWRAWANAGQAGRALAALIGEIGQRRPGPVDLMSHSLGARVALTAMAALPPASLGRAVLLAAAEFQRDAAAALAAPAGRGAEVINVVSRENDPYDKLLEWLVDPRARRGQALGAGLGRAAANWMDVQIDCPRSRTALAALGYRVPPPVRRVCHWSSYLRPGLFALYGDLIRRRETLDLAALRARLPGRPEPRWSRLAGPAGLRPVRPEHQLRDA